MTGLISPTDIHAFNPVRQPNGKSENNPMLLFVEAEVYKSLCKPVFHQCRHKLLRWQPLHAPVLTEQFPISVLQLRLPGWLDFDRCTHLH